MMAESPKGARSLRGLASRGGAEEPEMGAGAGGDRSGGGSGDGKPPAAPSLWLEAWHDPLSSVRAYQACVRTGDVAGDGDCRLMVADAASKKLKVWKGTTMVAELPLLGRPTAVVSYYPMPGPAAVAVASGPTVFVYRGLRPYTKYTLPPLETDSQEGEVWEDLRGGRLGVAAALERLKHTRAMGVELTSRSERLLALKGLEDQEALVQALKEQPIVQQTVVTCMESLKKQGEQWDAVGCLVIGTEAKQVYILQPMAQQHLWRGVLPSTPAFLAVSGQYDVDYRIIVACRDTFLYTIKNGELLPQAIQLEALPCGVIRSGKNIVVALTNNVMQCYHLKGKKNWAITLPAPILVIELVAIERLRNTRSIAVALANREVRIYNDRTLVSVTTTHDKLTALRFGPFAREDNTLITVGKGGGLTVRILPRTAVLEAKPASSGPPQEQDVPLNLPKKTKLYVEQMEREREQGTDMHRQFQRDLCKLRLTAARAYVKVLTDGQGPISYTGGSSLRLNAQVHGLGPAFRLKLSLQNTGSRAVQDLSISTAYDRNFYQLQPAHISVPVLIPGLLYQQELAAESVDAEGAADNIRVYVCQGSASAVPLLSAIIKMPMSEIDAR